MPAAEDGESRKKRARARPLGFVEIKIGATGCIVPTLRNPRRVGQPVMYFSPEDRTGQPPECRRNSTLNDSSLAVLKSDCP